MRELEHKQKLKRRIYSTPALIILALVAIILARGAYGVVAKMEESRAYVKELEAKVGTLKSRQTELETSIAKLQTAEGVDSEIKGKFSVSKEGEKVAVIVDARHEGATSTESNRSWLGNIWRTISSLWR